MLVPAVGVKVIAFPALNSLVPVRFNEPLLLMYSVASKGETVELLISLVCGITLTLTVFVLVLTGLVDTIRNTYPVPPGLRLLGTVLEMFPAETELNAPSCNGLPKEPRSLDNCVLNSLPALKLPVIENGTA
jgi:hypothetical protein